MKSGEELKAHAPVWGAQGSAAHLYGRWKARFPLVDGATHEVRAVRADLRPFSALTAARAVVSVKPGPGAVSVSSQEARTPGP